MHHVTKFLLIIIAVFALLFTGCTGEAVARPASPRQQVQAQVALQPLRLLAFIDQSQSMEGARVTPVGPASFAPVYERLAISGGELAVGLVRDDSDRPFVRLFVPPPPEAPPTRPRPTNVFQAAAAQKREDAERARYEQLRRVWRADVATRQAAFARAIEPLLARASDAPATDIWSALRRADVFVSEPNAFPRTTKNVVVFLSDGVETASNTAPPRSCADPSREWRAQM